MRWVIVLLNFQNIFTTLDLHNTCISLHLSTVLLLQRGCLMFFLWNRLYNIMIFSLISVWESVYFFYLSCWRLVSTCTCPDKFLFLVDSNGFAVTFWVIINIIFPISFRSERNICILRMSDLKILWVSLLFLCCFVLGGVGFW